MRHVQRRTELGDALGFVRTLRPKTVVNGSGYDAPGQGGGSEEQHGHAVWPARYGNGNDGGALRLGSDQC